MFPGIGPNEVWFGIITLFLYIVPLFILYYVMKFAVRNAILELKKEGEL